MIRALLPFLLLLASNYALSQCKVNQYGHSLCQGEKALLVTSSFKKELLNKNTDLTVLYKPVILKILHFHEPIAVISGRGIRSQKVHVDQLLGNKLCENSNFCRKQKVNIKEECLAPGDSPYQEYKVLQVYEDQELVEDVVEIQRGSFIFKKTRIITESCLVLSLGKERN